MHRLRRLVFRVFLATGVLAPVPLVAAAEPAATSPEFDQLFETAHRLFEQFAPAEIKAQYDFPTKQQWDGFLVQLQRVLAGDSLDELAAFAPQARSVLTPLRTVPGYEDLADWLEQRLDEMEGAQQAMKPTPPPPAPKSPGQPHAVAPPGQPVPHYNLWLARVRGRAVPARAASLMPTLQRAFVAEGVPAELAWLAEAESSLNPAARSPAGAKGLFQFMPDTAKAMGLSTFLPDDRTHPEKSARAAARYLRALHGKFGNWALALAAYNAGEGRVSRTLAKRGATSFTAIADALPAETRMYVPKVCALIQLRAGISPAAIGTAKK
jgi:membrane-bound lytic murein transglycosylase D